jgi:serine phosphatase RsbU (regulator of sigma subunit)
VTSLQERTRLSRALNDIDIRIHAALGSDVILQSALDGFVDALGADVGDIKLLDGDEWVVSYEQGLGRAEVGSRLSLPEAPVAVEVARRREPVVIPDLLAQQAIPYTGFPLEHGLRSVVAFPLVVRDEIIGGLFAWMREPSEFSPGELDFARRMAASLALALENARLYEAERQARERAEKTEQQLMAELGTTRVLLDASDEFASTTDPEEILDRLGRIVMEATGINRVFINLIDTSRQVLTPKIAASKLVAPTGNTIAFADLTETSMGAIRAKKTALLDFENPDVPEYDRSIASANEARLVLFVPLLYLGEIIGHIAMDQPGERYDFSAKEIRIVESIAAQAVIALQNARQYEREHRIAETLQEALLAEPEHLDGVGISYLYRAAWETSSVGGDFYDVFALDAEWSALIVGDVAGKGLMVAPLTALMRDGARAYLLESADPGDCCRRLNALAYRFTPQDKFATVFIGVLNRTTGALRYCSAAHPPSVIIGRDGVRMLQSGESGLLGAFAEAEFETAETVLQPGEMLVMVTDGVTEARRGSEFFGERGLVDALERLGRATELSQLPHALLAEVLEFAGGRLHDDVVVVCARYGNQTGEASG